MRRQFVAKGFSPAACNTQNAKQADDAQTEPLGDGATAFFIDEQQLSVEFAGAGNGLGLPTIELNA